MPSSLHDEFLTDLGVPSEALENPPSFQDKLNNIFKDVGTGLIKTDPNAPKVNTDTTSISVVGLGGTLINSDTMLNELGAESKDLEIDPMKELMLDWQIGGCNTKSSDSSMRYNNMSRSSKAGNKSKPNQNDALTSHLLGNNNLLAGGNNQGSMFCPSSSSSSSIGNAFPTSTNTTTSKSPLFGGSGDLFAKIAADHKPVVTAASSTDKKEGNDEKANNSNSAVSSSSTATATATNNSNTNNNQTFVTTSNNTATQNKPSVGEGISLLKKNDDDAMDVDYSATTAPSNETKKRRSSSGNMSVDLDNPPTISSSSSMGAGSNKLPYNTVDNLASSGKNSLLNSKKQEGSKLANPLIKKCVNFFTYGDCVYGKKCKFSHELPTTKSTNSNMSVIVDSLQKKWDKHDLSDVKLLSNSETQRAAHNFLDELRRRKECEAAGIPFIPNQGPTEGKSMSEIITGDKKLTFNKSIKTSNTNANAANEDEDEVAKKHKEANDQEEKERPKKKIKMSFEDSDDDDL